MENARRRAILGAALVVAVSLACMVMFALWANPPAIERAPTSENLANGSVHGISGNQNFTVSNANAWGRRSFTPIAPSPELHTYPTVATVKPFSQTVGAYTVTLYPVYANANRIVLTYTVESPPIVLSPVKPYWDYSSGKEASHEPPKLSDERGNVFRLLDQTYLASFYESPSWLIVFDIGGLTDNVPTTLNLHLVLDGAKYKDFARSGGYMIRSVDGLFTFDFTMPMDPVRRVAEVNQTLSTADGGAVTIQRVIVTRQDTRIFWQYYGPDQYGRTPTPISRVPFSYACCRLTLGQDGDPITPNARAGRAVLEDGFVDQSLVDKQGEWTVSAWYFSTWMGDRYDPDIPGPVFHFTVPPAISTR